jgi:hypothetical protein
MSLLFPKEPRAFPGRRWIKILLRAVHVLCAGGVFGAYLFAGATGAWVVAVIVSGLVLLVIDLHESGAFVLQMRGLVLVVKVGLFLALPWCAPYEAHVLGFLIVVSVVSSHAPASFRYRLLLGKGRISCAETQG